MALFKPYKITSDKLEDLAIQEGQIIITTDTKKLYVDVSNTERIEITSEIDLSDYVTTSTLTSTIGEEASARQKQDQLLEQSIDDKLGADDIVAGSNVQVSHDEESGHITISATDTKYSAGTGLGMIGNGFYILNGGIGLNQLANDSVSEDKLVDGAVDTAKIADGAVTADKLAEGVIPEIPDVTLASLGVTATAAELNKLDGVTATAAEINYLDGVTSSIQSQLNTKAGLVSDKTDLKAGDDLNDFDTIGTYRSASGTITAEIANIPNGTSGAGFLLWVVSMYGKESNFTGTVLQIFMGGASGNTPIWIRRGGAGAWSAWQEVYTSTNKPTAAEIGAAASSHTHSNATTSAAGFLPKLGGGTTNYLRADGTWAKPPDTNTTYTLSSFGITATAAELNKLDGVTTTATQLNYLNTLTGNVQTQLNGKAASSHSHDGTYTRIYNLGIQAFGGNQNGITTAQFLTLLNGYGAFSDKSWITRGSWSYASNQYIKDTGCGNIHLAGCTVEVMGTSTTNCTIRIHTPTTSSSGVSNGDFIYINNGPEYTPGWRRLYSTKYKPTAADIGAAASSHTHSYLPLSGGTLTGTLTARTITPAADSTYNIGSSTVRYANIYADTFTGALSGNATSATSASYWTTARTLSFTGDVTGSVSVRGNANMSCALTIGSGKVGTTELATDAVTSAKIAANAVTASEIASGAVGLSELSSAVGTVAVQSATPTDSHVKLWIKV